MCGSPTSTNQNRGNVQFSKTVFTLEWMSLEKMSVPRIAVTSGAFRSLGGRGITARLARLAETIGGDEGSGARDGRDVGVGEGTRGDDAFGDDPRVAPLGAR